MRVRPRFVGRLGLADAFTATNAALGFVATAVATVDARLAARIVLLAAIADGLDGVVARRRGGTPAGEFLDSLADVASFAVAPAVIVFAVATAEWGLTPTDPSGRAVVALAVPALFVAMGVVRLGLYNAYDTDEEATEGVQTTLAATILAALLLGDVAGLLGVDAALLLLVWTALFVYLMVAPVTLPELFARDALVMGGVQALAVLFPNVLGGVFPRALLLFALAYAALAPRFYWRQP